MFLAYLLAASTTAPSLYVSPTDPASIVTLLQREGYRAKLGKDKGGDPLIVSAISGTDFQIYFYGCTDGRDCTSLSFHSGYAMPVDKKPTADKLNQYNAQWRFSRAYKDSENDPILEMDLVFGGERMPEKMFLKNLNLWGSTMIRFQEYIGW